MDRGGGPRAPAVGDRPGAPRTGTRVAAAVRASGGHVDPTLSIVNGFAAHVSPAEAAALSRSAGVRAVTPDATLTSASSSYDPSVPGASYAGSVRAPSIWGSGDTGAGVGVALLDTGVTVVPDLVGACHRRHRPLRRRQQPADNYGHGTVIAGLIAGSGASSGGQYPGIAPGAMITSVKVAGRNGVTDVSQVLAGLQWIGTFGPDKGIRVVNIAWGTPSNQSPPIDPLDFAVERLWGMGITVVASAGNHGPGPRDHHQAWRRPRRHHRRRLRRPRHPGQLRRRDCRLLLAWANSQQRRQARPARPRPHPHRDPCPPAPPIEQQNPQALVDNGYIRGSGTSQATAVTTGGVALLLAKHPSWTPDKIKYALMSTAKPLNGGVPATTEGAGELRLNRAFYANVWSAPTQALTDNGMGSIEASRGDQHVTVTCPGDDSPTIINGETDIFCRAWDGEQWSGEQWSGEQWSGEQWSGEQWSGEQWSGEQWSGEQWSGEQWSGEQWSGYSWDPPRHFPHRAG